MKTLFLLRHAKASRDFPSIHDIDRPLTERGYTDSEIISDQLVQLKSIPALLITSPAVRAFSTAMVFSRIMDMEVSHIQVEPALYESSVSDYINVISDIGDHVQSAMIVGHNDTISEVARKILQDSEFESLRTCGIAIISSKTQSWKEFVKSKGQMAAMLYPSMFKKPV